MANEYPGYFARFYDLIYHKLRDGVDNQYFLDQIKQTKGKVLEVGVGTGRFFIDALSRDADIYGFDISRSMLDVLKTKLNKTQQDRVSVQNIIEFQFEWDEDNGKRTEIWKSPLRFFFRYELEHLIERTEFKSYQIFGDYKGNELGSDSKEFVVVCRR